MLASSIYIVKNNMEHRVVAIEESALNNEQDKYRVQVKDNEKHIIMNVNEM